MLKEVKSAKKLGGKYIIPKKTDNKLIESPEANLSSKKNMDELLSPKEEMVKSLKLELERVVEGGKDLAQSKEMDGRGADWPQGRIEM